MAALDQMLAPTDCGGVVKNVFSSAPLAWLKNASVIGNQSAYFSAGNIHYAPAGTNPGGAPLGDQLQLARAYSGDKPVPSELGL